MPSHVSAFRALRLPLLVVCLCASATIPASAMADTTWTKISSDYASNITVPEMAVLGSTAVVAWEQDTSPSTADILSDTFQTSPANDVANGVPGKVAEGWDEVDYHQSLMPTPAGGLEIAFGGTHSTALGDPLNGLIGATHNADGSWSAPTTIATGGGSGQADTGVLGGATPIVANNATGAINVIVNPTAPTSTVVADLEAQLPPAATATCRSSRSTRPATSGPPGTRAGRRTASTCSSSTRRRVCRSPRPRSRPQQQHRQQHPGDALACAATCRLVYGVEPSGATSDEVVSWGPGEAAPTTIASLPGTGAFAAAYRSDGRLWVAWWNGKTYSYELGDATGANGTVLDAGSPAGRAGAYALRIAPVGDDLLMARTTRTRRAEHTPCS